MPKKGGQFERDLCKELSLWWTGGKREDVFWRTATSGGRATQRAKQGKGTFGQHGDVQATDPIGQPLIDLCLIEIKRGYSKHSMADMLDKPKDGATQMWEGWVGKLVKQVEQAGALSWLLITKRDRRDACIFFPIALGKELRAVGSNVEQGAPVFVMRVVIDTLPEYIHVAGVRLDHFLREVTPKQIRRVRRAMKGDQNNG